ncbi:MAG: HRDC domain-containing protein [Planctomycetota bacterium]
MRIKLFTLRYSPTLGAFDESSLQQYTRDKEILDFREHFFTVHDVPHLLGILIWQDPALAMEDSAPAREAARTASLDLPPNGGARDRPDPARGLDEAKRLLFNSLREWRTAKAREEGVPPFLVLTNRHLVEIVRRRPESANALGAVPGIGPGKVKRYGEEVLRLLAGGGPSS